MKKSNFKLIILGITLVFILISCASSKSKNKLTEKQVYKWENKVVSKRKFDKLLYKYTYDKIVNSLEEEQEVLKELSVVYDTLPKNKKD